VSRKVGVRITHVEEDARCSELNVGDVITQVRGQQVRNTIDFETIVRVTKEGEFVPMVVNGKPGNCVAIGDGELGIQVQNIPSAMLKLSPEIGGGIISVYHAKDNVSIEALVEIVKKRIEFLKLPMEAYLSDGNVYVAGVEEDEALVKPCHFKAQIRQELSMENGSATLRLGEKEHVLTFFNSKVKFDNNTYSVNESFVIEGVEINLFNVTNDSVTVSATVFSNDDIWKVLTQLSETRIEWQTYVVSIPMELSSNGARKFKLVTQPIESFFTGREFVLKAQLVYRLDGHVLSTLNIPKEMVEQPLVSVLVIAFATDAHEAQRIKSEVEMCLTSAPLPVELEKIEVKSLQAKYDLFWIVTGIVLCLLSFSILTSRKYGLKITLTKLWTFTSTILLVLGFAGWSQQILAVGWIIDLYSVLGLIALVVLSWIDCLFVCKRFLEREVRLEKVRQIVWLVSIGVGFVTLFTPWKGFGLGMLMGTFIELFLTRPLFVEALAIS